MNELQKSDTAIVRGEILDFVQSQGWDSHGTIEPSHVIHWLIAEVARLRARLEILEKSPKKAK